MHIKRNRCMCKNIDRIGVYIDRFEIRLLEKGEPCARRRAV